MVNTHLEAYNQFYSNSAINEAKEKNIEVKKKTISIIIVAIVCMFVSSFLIMYRRVPLVHKD